ncbi:hypothetical protein D3C73_1362650 [compost metagenome]
MNISQRPQFLILERSYIQLAVIRPVVHVLNAQQASPFMQRLAGQAERNIGSL